MTAGTVVRSCSGRRPTPHLPACGMIVTSEALALARKSGMFCRAEYGDLDYSAIIGMIEGN